MSLRLSNRTYRSPRIVFVPLGCDPTQDTVLLSAPGGSTCVEARFHKCYVLSHYHLIMLPQVLRNVYVQTLQTGISALWAGLTTDDRRVIAGCVIWQMSQLAVSLCLACHC